MKKAAPVKAPNAQQKLSEFGINLVCERTAMCVSQRKIAEEIGVDWKTLMTWIDADPARIQQYARAREAQADKFAEDIIEIADEAEVEARHNGEEVTLDLSAAAVARNRLRVDARKWLASKMAPKKYGDKLEIEGTMKTLVLKDLSGT